MFARRANSAAFASLPADVSEAALLNWGMAHRAFAAVLKYAFGRFTKLLEGTERAMNSVIVEPDEVRKSGLLKDVIRLRHTDESQPSDLSLLAGAARELLEYESAWADYQEKEGGKQVRPILVVQVQDGSRETEGERIHSGWFLV